MVSDDNDEGGHVLPDPRTRPTLTIEETARILSLGRSSAYAAVHAGEIPSLRIGHRLLVPTAALLRLLGASSPADDTLGGAENG
jgi:excisionase family DNA binding protein